MILALVVLVLLAANTVALVIGFRRRERALEDRWQGRLVKCDAVLVSAERAEQRTHEGLVEIARCHDRMQDHLLAMERVLTDPRVHQALR